MTRLVLQDAAADLAEDWILRGLGQHPEQRDGERLGDQLQSDRLQVPGRGAEQRVENFLDVAGERIGLALEPQRDIAMQHLIVPRLVDHLAGLEQLGILTDDILDHLAAHQHRAVLTMHERRDPPARHEAVDLDLLRRRQPVPERGAVNIDQIVGDQPAIAVERLLPVDIGRGIPLVELGLLVEPPHIGVLAIVIMAEIRGIAGLDVMTAFHLWPLCLGGADAGLGLCQPNVERPLEVFEHRERFRVGERY